MNSLDNLGEVFSADVIIVGAGPSGLIAANRIKQQNSDIDVLIIDKQAVGHSGALANKTAGVIFIMSEDDDIDKFCHFHLDHIGHWLNDQEMLEIFAKSSAEVAVQLEEWGIKIQRGADGKLIKIKDLPLWSLCGFDLDWMDKLRKIAVKLGVRMVNKTHVTELLTQGDRVVGAVGFDITNGAFRIFKSKATFLTTGGSSYMVPNMFYSSRGNGIAAAYRAGAQMRNAEYGNFYNLQLVGNNSQLAGGQFAIYNNTGENLAKKYCKEYECDIDIDLILGMEKEVMEGKGPCRFEPSEFGFKNPLALLDFAKLWSRPVAERFWGTLMGKEHRYNPDKSARPEVIAGFCGNLSCTRVDHDMRTTLEGLWALGDMSHTGSAWNGATAGPPGRIRGAALSFASTSAILSTKSSLEYLKTAEEPQINADQVKQYKEEIYAPMERKQGISPRALIAQLKDVVAPPRYSARKSKERLDEAIGKVGMIREQIAEVSPAADWHMLGLTHDLRAMTQCADIFFNASLHRKESRGFHYREDYPERDDKNWLKWVIVQQQNGKMVVTTEDVPIEKYKIKPTDDHSILDDVKVR